MSSTVPDPVDRPRGHIKASISGDRSSLCHGLSARAAIL